MSDQMSFAELEAQHVALLPARTVLSLLTAGPQNGADSGDQAAPNGAPGHPGEPGQSIQGSGRTVGYDHVDQFGDSTSH